MAQDILNQIKDEFYNKFINKYKSEKSIDEILFFKDAIDNPDQLNKELSEIPALYAYYASVKRDAEQKCENIKNEVTLWEQERYESIIETLKEKGAKSTTQKAIDAEFIVLENSCGEYKELKSKERSAKDLYDKIGVIERAILTKMDCLRVIAQLIGNMMNTGIYIKKPLTKKGEF